MRYRSPGGDFGVGLPVRVVERTEKQIVVFLAEGTEVAWPVFADGRGLRDVSFEERWSLPRRAIVRPWERSDLVMIFPSGRRHSLWVFQEGGRTTGWYVNLEAPHVVGARTIDSQDGILDVWVPADSGQPEWKDEDEFAAAQRVGRLSLAQAREIRGEGERVIADHPWPTGWEDWRPPSGWAVPQLPADWNAGE